MWCVSSFEISAIHSVMASCLLHRVQWPISSAGMFLTAEWSRENERCFNLTLVALLVRICSVSFTIYGLRFMVLISDRSQDIYFMYTCDCCFTVYIILAGSITVFSCWFERTCYSTGFIKVDPGCWVYWIYFKMALWLCYLTYCQGFSQITIVADLLMWRKPGTQ